MSYVFQISQEQPPAAVRLEPQRPLEGDSSGLMGASVNWVGTQPKATWSVSISVIYVSMSVSVEFFAVAKDLCEWMHLKDFITNF